MKNRRLYQNLVFLFLLLGYTLHPHHVCAKDIRLALLVAHPNGWKEDPKLKYVITGDLQPMATQLKKIGFDVEILQSSDAETVRRALNKIRLRVQQTPEISTFLFYYTGHADKKALHLGSLNKQSSFLYREFLSLFSSIKTKHKVAIFDACYSSLAIREFGSLKNYRRYKQKKIKSKGVKKKHPLDIEALEFPNQGDEQSVRIISSSAALSWENSSLRASVFTYYLLQGLRGRADSNLDGKVDLEELFRFTSRHAERKFAQKPQQYVRKIEGARPYIIAPAYNSYLWLSPSIWGELQVSVEGSSFFWSKYKKKNRAILLPVIAGKGVVFLQQNQKCFRKKLILQKQKISYLHKLFTSKSRPNRWTVIHCRKIFKNQPKGSIKLDPTPRRLPIYTIEFQGGLLNSQMTRGDLLGGALFGGGQMSLHFDWLSFALEAWSTTINYPQTISRHPLLLSLKGMTGYRWDSYPLDFFIGTSLGVGLLFQNLDEKIYLGGVFHYGLSASIGLWLSPLFGLALSSNVGFSLNMVNQQIKNHFSWSIQLGPRIRL